MSGTRPSSSALHRPDDDWDSKERHETPLERADRNWGELLQELRVAQTGVQILFAFLLTLPFTQRFASITTFEKMTYVVTLLLTAVASALLIGPVAYHRAVFRLHVKSKLVVAANRMAIGGLVVLALAICCAVLLITDVLFSGLVAATITAGTVLVFVGLWWVLPAMSRMHRERDS